MLYRAVRSKWYEIVENVLKNIDILFSAVTTCNLTGKKQFYKLRRSKNHKLLNILNSFIYII